VHFGTPVWVKKMPKTLVLSILVHFGTLGMRRGVFEPNSDNKVGVWMSVDAMANMEHNLPLTPYHFSADNPVG
jgi:hypothetical protein